MPAGSRRRGSAPLAAPGAPHTRGHKTLLGAPRAPPRGPAASAERSEAAPAVGAGGFPGRAQAHARRRPLAAPNPPAGPRPPAGRPERSNGGPGSLPLPSAVSGRPRRAADAPRAPGGPGRRLRAGECPRLPKSGRCVPLAAAAARVQEAERRGGPSPSKAARAAAGAALRRPSASSSPGRGPARRPSPSRVVRPRGPRARASERGGGRASGAGRRRPDRASERPRVWREGKPPAAPRAGPSLPLPAPPPTAEQHHVGAGGQSQ